MNVLSGVTGIHVSVAHSNLTKHRSLAQDHTHTTKNMFLLQHCDWQQRTSAAPFRRWRQIYTRQCCRQHQQTLALHPQGRPTETPTQTANLVWTLNLLFTGSRECYITMLLFFCRYAHMQTNKLEVPFYIDWWRLELTSLDGWLKRFNDARQSCRQWMIDKTVSLMQVTAVIVGWLTMKFHLMQVKADIAGWLTKTFHWRKLELSLLDGWLRSLTDAS